MTQLQAFLIPVTGFQQNCSLVFDKDQNKIVEAKELFGIAMPDYSKPPVTESGGGGLVSHSILRRMPYLTPGRHLWYM